MSAIVVENDSRYELLREVIRAVAGGESTLSHLRRLGIDSFDFYRALDADPSLASDYASAQKARAELLAAEVIEIADTDEDAARARNRIQARQWFAGKVHATKWGDKIQLEVTERISLVDAINEAKGRVLSASYQRIDDEAETPAIASIPAPQACDIQSGEAPKGAESIDDLLE